MNGQGSIITLLYQGGWLSILVLLVLLVMSVISWAVILRKWWLLSGMTRKSKFFLKSVDLKDGLSDMALRSEQHPDAYTSRLFHAVYVVFKKQISTIKNSDPDRDDRQQLGQKLERALDKAIITEKATMEKELGFLATISSSAPFIGLLGTVTGIIDAFYSIAAQGASSIAVVAPGISAALVATAVGLFTAIPALVGYNLFREKARELSNDMNRFGLDVLALFDTSIEDADSESKGLFPDIKLRHRKT